MQYTGPSFSRSEALTLWARLVAGWAKSLDPTGARTLMDGIPNAEDAGGSYEGVTRMLWGLGSWLSNPDRPSTITWNGECFDLERLTRRALVNGCDPLSPAYWLNTPVLEFADQRSVESAQVAIALWQSRDRIWSHLNDQEQANITSFLEQTGQRQVYWKNNWSLFWVVNHTARKVLGLPYDQSILDEILFAFMDGVYCGDGWYDDARRRGANYFDNYLTWVYAMHTLLWAAMDGDSIPARRDELLDRVRAWMQHYPYFFAADGACVEYGRSLAYKFCRLGAPLWAYKLGVWPHSVGMLKRLVGRHLRWYVDRGAIRPDGTLRQTLTASGSPTVLEPYISTGAPYWAMQVFSGLWALDDDDPFWTVAEEPLPAEQNYTKVFPQPGWVVMALDGHVQLFNAGVARRYGAKYSKLVYGTRSPFNAGLDHGQPGVDSCLRLRSGPFTGQREHKNLAYAVGDGWLRMRYPVRLGDAEHRVETILIPLGHVHLRAHRVTLQADTSVSADEASAPLGYNAGAVPTIRSVDGWLFIQFDDEFYNKAVGIKPIHGYSGVSVSEGTENIAYSDNLLASLSVDSLANPHELVCLVYDGPAIPEPPTILVESARWEPNGRFVAQIGDQTLTVPALP